MSFHYKTCVCFEIRPHTYYENLGGPSPRAFRKPQALRVGLYAASPRAFGAVGFSLLSLRRGVVEGWGISFKGNRRLRALKNQYLSKQVKEKQFILVRLAV